MVLSTFDHHELLQEVASKCAARFSLIPPVRSISSQKDVHDHPPHGEIDEHGFFQGNIENSSKMVIYLLRNYRS